MTVSNTTPLINLAQLDLLPVLRDLFLRITITSQVKKELEEKQDLFPKTRGIAELDFVDVREVRPTPLLAELTRELHLGEASCLALALETGSSARLLLDDVAAREAARHHRLPFTGTLGFLLRARSRGLVNAKAGELVSRLRGEARFWLHPELEQHFVRLYEALP